MSFDLPTVRNSFKLAKAVAAGRSKEKEHSFFLSRLSRELSKSFYLNLKWLLECHVVSWKLRIIKQRRQCWRSIPAGKQGVRFRFPPGAKVLLTTNILKTPFFDQMERIEGGADKDTLSDHN